MHASVLYDVEVDSGELGVREEMDLIAGWLRKTWSIEVLHDLEPRATLPALSAWDPGEEVSPAPWER